MQAVLLVDPHNPLPLNPYDQNIDAKAECYELFKIECTSQHNGILKKETAFTLTPSSYQQISHSLVSNAYLDPQTAPVHQCSTYQYYSV
jgi:hypothetical protein